VPAAACRPVYQSAMVDVYARFVMADIGHGSPPYMLHRKALFRLTDLLRDRIRLSDQSVARLRAAGTVVDGLKPGVTDIQVCIIVRTLMAVMMMMMMMM